MKITKFGHCCLVIDINGTRVLIDPGAQDYSRLPADVKNISAVLITHEHADHLHIDSLKNLLANNGTVLVITNTSVGKILEQEKILYTKVEDKESFNLNGINISGFGDTHAEIYNNFGQVQNTGFMIDGLCCPGDSFNLPYDKVDILALPVAGPWMKIRDAIDYAKKNKSKNSISNT